MRHIEMDVEDNIKELIPCSSTFRKWVYDHAPEVMFLMVLFGITWIIGLVNIFISWTK